MKSPLNHWKNFFAPTAIAVCLSLALLTATLLAVQGVQRMGSAPASDPSAIVLAPAGGPSDPSATDFPDGQPVSTGAPDAAAAALPGGATISTRVPDMAATALDAGAPISAGAAEAVLPTAAPEPFEYLPVIHSAETNEKKIAITVDDCFQADNLKTIARLAYKNGGKLTLFPIGQNVTRKGMDEILQICAFQLGFEIENHTWSHARIFRLYEEEMASEIWRQRAAVNQALGVNYEQHFFRLMGGDGEYDQRTHNYLKQLGYRGIADWSLSGSNAELEQIQSALRPGAIFLFHTTDEDTAKLKKFIPYAVQQGYSLVTLNELLGLPENAVSDLSTFDPAQPTPAPYTPDYQAQKKGDYSWATVLIQRRLVELGFLDGSAKSALGDDLADGVYGDSTCTAVEAFQAASGLPPTGVADAETQRALFTDNASSLTS